MNAERAFYWLSKFSFLAFVFIAGSAVGSVETAKWMADEMEARFECVQK